MKRILFVIAMITLLFVACCPQVQAQTNQQNEKITVNASDLTVDQLAKIKLEQTNAELQKKLDTYGKWVGVGGEIGTAVKEGLTAIVDVSDKFGKTDVGKFTLVMIAWKVMGEDAVGIIVGLLFFFVSITVVTVGFNRIIKDKKVLIENPGFFSYPKKYEVIKSDVEGEAKAWSYFLYIIVLLIIIGISCAIIF